MPYTIKPGSFKYKKSNGQFSEIDCFEGPDLTEEVVALEKDKAPIIIDSATGNPIVLTDGADGLPVEGMKIHFSPVQSGTGNPSPSNIRPISGFDGINIFRTGVNIWDEELELGGINSSTGIPYTSTSALRAKNYIPVVPGAKYYFKSSSTSVTRCWYDKDKNYISTGYVVNTEITAPDNAYFFRFDIPSSYGTTYNHDISLNYPSTDTVYHPYTGQSYPVTFPDGQTIYGGILDAVNWVLTVEWESFSVKLSDATIKTEYDGINLYRFDNVFTHDVLNNSNQKCDIAGYEFGTEAVLTNHFYVFNKTIRLYMLTPVDETKEFTIVCPITEPYEIQLDPVAVTTLLGDNTIWSDANGTIELDYRADTKLFVDNNNPVTDIRVKGASLVQNGIVNMPLAQASTPGLMMVGAGYGLKAADINGNSAGRIQTDQAWPDLIKGFADQYRPITPKYLPDAVFQGLARAAGDTTQAASSNALGTFTPGAIVAIQKMLGVYQAPWELIREDSFTNDLVTASDHIITVDGNGQPFELTDALMLFELPQNENTAEKGYYGQIWFYYDTDSVIAPEPGSASRTANGPSQGAWYMINYSNKIVTTQSTVFATNANSMYWRARYIQYMNGAANSNMGIFIANDFAINKINIKQVKGEAHYKLYGRRKWTT